MESTLNIWYDIMIRISCIVRRAPPTGRSWVNRKIYFISCISLNQGEIYLWHRKIHCLHTNNRKCWNKTQSFAFSDPILLNLQVKIKYKATISVLMQNMQHSCVQPWALLRWYTCNYSMFVAFGTKFSPSILSRPCFCIINLYKLYIKLFLTFMGIKWWMQMYVFGVPVLRCCHGNKSSSNCLFLLQARELTQIWPLTPVSQTH